MDTRYISHSRHRARGAIRPSAIAIVAVVAVLAAASWFLIIKPHQDMMETEAGSHPSTPVQSGTAAAPPPANVGAMSINQLLSEARKAVNEQRLLAPAGNNAFEFYLKVLEKQPGNQVATDALRETFPVGASVAEQAINQRDFNDAQRQIDLLAKADPANYTLTILRSKLDAQRKLLDQEQQKALDQQHQQQLAAQRAADEKAASEKAAQEQQAAAAQARQAPAPTRATTPSQPVEQAAQTPTPAVQPPTPAVLIRSVNPRYPTTAQRARTEGYVVVRFTVTAEGRTSNIQVTDAQPRHVFDRAAIDAVSRWEFTPATRDGKPVDSSVTNRINFKL